MSKPVLCIAASFGRTDAVRDFIGSELFPEAVLAYEDKPIEFYLDDVKISGKPIVLVILGPLGHVAMKYLLDDFDKPQEERRVVWVHSIPTGVDWYRLGELKQELKGVCFTSGRGAYSRVLGMHALYSILYFNRQTALLQANRRNRIWDAFNSVEPSGSRVGIIGYGDIGRGAARMIQPLDVHITGVRRSAVEPNTVDEFGVLLTSGDDERDRVIRESDFLINILPGVPETKGLFNAEKFATMKPNAIYINIGRGSTQVDADLAAALQNGVIAGASLDVFETEPVPKESPLFDLPDDKFLMTSHNACLTTLSFPAAAGIFVELAKEFFETGVVSGYRPDAERGY